MRTAVPAGMPTGIPGHVEKHTCLYAAKCSQERDSPTGWPPLHYSCMPPEDQPIINRVRPVCLPGPPSIDAEHVAD